MVGGENDAQFYRALWERLVGDAFTIEKLVGRARADGGVDIENLTDSDLRSLIEERYEGSWSEVGFTGSEMLSSYSVPGGIETPDQIVGWVFAAFMVSDAVEHDAADWAVNFDPFLNGFLVVRDKLVQDEALSIFERAFQRPH